MYIIYTSILSHLACGVAFDRELDFNVDSTIRVSYLRFRITVCLFQQIHIVFVLAVGVGSARRFCQVHVNY
jgi:hypothetical protein